MNASFAVLDACVLVNAAVRDTLLRLAQKGLFIPCWSDDIMSEVVRTLHRKLNKTPEQTSHLVAQLKLHFDDAWVSDYQSLIPTMQNDPKDRHVLACAVKSGARLIVTFNLRHFESQALEPWLIDAQHPDDFLREQHRQHPRLVTETLREQASAIDWDFNALLTSLSKSVPQAIQQIKGATDG